MTDNDTLVDNNFKDFGKLSSNQVSCYEYLTDIDRESCYDRVCLECGNNHSFRGNFEDVTTLIDLLPEIFDSISISKLQEFVN